MNYLDNFNSTAFDRTIASRQSDADQIYDAMSAHVQDVINRAFAGHPLNPNIRWGMICMALQKAETALNVFVDLNATDHAIIDDIADRAIDANIASSKYAVLQETGAIMDVYRTALDRLEA